MPTDPNTIPVVFLKSARVYLRPFALSDLPTLLAWINDPDMRPHLSRSLPINEAQEREFIEKHSCTSEQLAFLICEAKTHRSVGACGLHGIHWPDRACELGIFLADEKSRGSGLGSEVLASLLDYAFGRLNLHRCWLRVVANNQRAIRCYERLGFVAEGAEREARFSDGAYADILRYSILDREWSARTSPSQRPKVTGAAEPL